MKFCTNCGQQCNDEMSFCSKCGNALINEPQEYFCPTCGKSLGEKFDSFCPYCGQAFVDTKQNVSSNTDNAKATAINYMTKPKEEIIQNEEKQIVFEKLITVSNNDKWIGFKGRINRIGHVPKVLVLSFISFILLFIIPYMIESSNLIYNLKYFTSYYDNSYLKSSLSNFLFLGIIQLIVGIALLGLVIRRFRDIDKSIWVIIGTYILAMVTSYLLPNRYYFGNIIMALPVLYGCFAKSVYENEVLQFNNKYEKSRLNYACCGVMLVILSSFYLLINNDKYASLIQQAMTPNGQWIHIEDTCFIRVPALSKNSKGVPIFQKMDIGRKRIPERIFNDGNGHLIASGNTGTKIYFQKAINDFPDLENKTVYSSEILSINENDRESHRKKLAEILHCSIDDVTVSKAYKPEKLGTAYGLVLHVEFKKSSNEEETHVTYLFVNKHNAYYITWEYPYNANDNLWKFNVDDLHELDKKSLEYMVKNIIWKI